jgi:NAD(P)-dependent dehydrogenase (short-subunit alcohol dehydrogenase family)
MKTVVITGTSKGIGLALANKFLTEGYRVIGTSTSGKVNIKNPNFEAVKLDLLDPKSILKASKIITKKAPKIDILINNAGIGLEPVGATNLEIPTLRKHLEVNLIGTIDLTERLLPKISPEGQIINTSSIMATLSDNTDTLDDPCYRISKTAINMYTVTLASRPEMKNITVSSLHPGWVKTDMGGEGATREPKDAADQIFTLATTPHKTGLFWYDNKEISW